MSCHKSPDKPNLGKCGSLGRLSMVLRLKKCCRGNYRGLKLTHQNLETLEMVNKNLIRE